MNNQTENYKIVSSDYISQGRLANISGSAAEEVTNDDLVSMGLSPVPYKYPAIWNNPDTNRLNEVDFDLDKNDGLGIIIEQKNQNSSGSVDEKFVTALYNAGQKIECEHFVLLFTGSHWLKGRGKNIVKEAKIAAAKFMEHPETFCIAAKTLHVMLAPELIEFVKQIKKEKLQNG